MTSAYDYEVTQAEHHDRRRQAAQHRAAKQARASRSQHDRDTTPGDDDPARQRASLVQALRQTLATRRA